MQNDVVYQFQFSVACYGHYWWKTGWLGQPRQFPGIWIDASLYLKAHVLTLVKKLRLRLGFYFWSKSCFSFNVNKHLVAGDLLIHCEVSWLESAWVDPEPPPWDPCSEQGPCHEQGPCPVYTWWSSTCYQLLPDICLLFPASPRLDWGSKVALSNPVTVLLLGSCFTPFTNILVRQETIPSTTEWRLDEWVKTLQFEILACLIWAHSLIVATFMPL